MINQFFPCFSDERRTFST